MTYTGRVAEGIEYGLGPIATIRILRNELLSSDGFIYVSEDDNGNLLIDGKRVSRIDYICDNTDKDGCLEKGYPEKVKVIISNPKRLGEYKSYPVFSVDVEFEAYEE